jgi:hypothetical protein
MGREILAVNLPGPNSPLPRETPRHAALWDILFLSLLSLAVSKNTSFAFQE